MNREDIHKKLDRFLADTMTYNDLPGIAAGVFLGEQEAFFEAAAGYSDLAERKPLHEDDIFHCASVSKLFTSGAIMKLAEAGVLSVDDRLADLLPDLHIADRRSETITLRQMLTHTSGLGDCEDYHWEEHLTGDDALRDYVYSDEVCAQDMIWEPGTGFRYSNVAFEILGHIVSVYSGRMPGRNGAGLSYEDFVAEYIMGPASMTSSTMKTFERTERDSMVKPYMKNADRSIIPVEHYPYTRQHAPSSTLTSNVHDLLSFGRVHLQKALFPSESYDEIWTEYATVPNNGEKMGLGWFMREQHGYTLYGHEGTDDGFRASFWICPELDIATVVLSNLSNAPVKKINKKLFTLLTEE